MLFNSYEFIFIYLPIVFITYFLLAHYRKIRAASAWLFISSLGFYGYWDVSYVPLLMGSIIFNYIVGAMIERKQQKKAILCIGVICDLLLLGYFKYTDFLLDTINNIAGIEMGLPHIILPLGISFFTFTQIAYLADAYRGETHKYSFLTYCLFVTIFPHLIAGPIIYHKDMIPQFSRIRNFVVNYKNMSMGIFLFSMGLFKKVVIADNLSPWVGEIFAKADYVTFVEAWAGALGYTFQLYFDFSGYSEMAIGLGLLFNLKFPVNFDSPYKACSIIDFWRRWHMTLGSWVKYYIYIPLGGNRAGELRKMRNLLAAMLLIGLWHGAGWTYVIWGGIHGALLVINHQWRRLDLHLPRAICWLMTFFSVVIAWVMFRAGSFHDALAMLRAMLNVQTIILPDNGIFLHLRVLLEPYGVIFDVWRLGEPLDRIVYNFLAIFVVLALCPNPIRLLERFKPNWKWFLLTLTILLTALYKLNDYTEFLYFQF